MWFFEKLERERESERDKIHFVWKTRKRKRERKKSFPGNFLEVSSWVVNSYGSIAGGREGGR